MTESLYRHLPCLADQEIKLRFDRLLQLEMLSKLFGDRHWIAKVLRQLFVTVHEHSLFYPLLRLVHRWVDRKRRQIADNALAWILRNSFSLSMLLAFLKALNWRRRVLV